MIEKAKIRINLNSREIEIEGSESFIQQYSDVIESYIEIIKSSPNAPVANFQKNETQNTAQPNNEDLPETFGEYYSRFPKTIKDVDKILIAGHYQQQKSDTNSFSTSDAAALLLEQGVKLSNPGAFLKSNLNGNRIFKHEGKFRVSHLGIDHIKKLNGV